MTTFDSTMLIYNRLLLVGSQFADETYRLLGVLGSLMSSNAFHGSRNEAKF